MGKVTKESRLSFRIPDGTSKKIDELVKQHSDIKDRSKFGTFAAEKFLKYLELRPEFYEKMRETIIALSKNVGGYELEEIQELMKREG
ncbi:MAG: hypothetical protein ACXAD7_19475 [Candidatus Kariarchaeaceae archaeon]|jgi:hypothetical protein